MTRDPTFGLAKKQRYEDMLRIILQANKGTDGPYVNKLLLNTIYLQSSLYSDRTSLRLELNDPQTTGMAFYHRFKALLVHYIDKPSVPTVVALLACGTCLVQYGKQSASWAFCGMACRIIMYLGYHLDDPKYSPSGEDLRLSALGGQKENLLGSIRH